MSTPAAGMDWVPRTPTFCLTATLARTPHQVLTAYGTDPARARLMTAQQALNGSYSAVHGSVLRAGALGDWAFCFEDGEPEGIKPPVLARLSEGTETLTVFHGGDGTNSASHLIDGRRIEEFEPGMPGTERGGERSLSRAVAARLSETPTLSRIDAALVVLFDHIGGTLTASMLNGPLLTAYVPDEDRQPLEIQPASPSARRRLGRPLGTVEAGPRPPRGPDEP